MLGLGTSAQASPEQFDPATLGENETIIARQDVLDPAAAAMSQWAADSDPDFLDVQVDAIGSMLHVYRVGARPEQSELKDRYQSFVPADFTLDFQPAETTARTEERLRSFVTGLVDAGSASASSTLVTMSVSQVLTRSIIHESPSQPVELETGNDSDDVGEFGEDAAVSGGEHLPVLEVGDASFDGAAA